MMNFIKRSIQIAYLRKGDMEGNVLHDCPEMYVILETSLRLITIGREMKIDRRMNKSIIYMTRL